MACTPNNPFYHVQPTAWMTLGTCKIRRLGRVMGQVVKVWVMGQVVKVRVVKHRVVKRRVVTFTEAKDFDYIPRQTFISSSHNAFRLLPISFVLAVYNNALSNRFWQMNILGDGRRQHSLLSPSPVLRVPYLRGVMASS